VPRAAGAGEDDGFVLSVVATNEGKSYLAVLDAKNIDAKPLAKAHLEHRVPLGFHGNFATGVV
jgi:all-trans-8'-apo-beta-carotenal 15,15'-oxygenase